MKILLVEDHPKLRHNIQSFFKFKGYVIEEAINGKEALEKVASSHYDLIILDINLPILDGREFLKVFRQVYANTPVIALTSNSMLEDKVEMFGLGVDDYITKPFEMKELDLRILALLKRLPLEKSTLLTNKTLTLDLEKKKVFLGEKEILLHHKEYLVLEFLLINQGYPKTKTQILSQVWGESEENLEYSSTTLEAHISTIRKKLGKEVIKTIKGLGYIIE